MFCHPSRAPMGHNGRSVDERVGQPRRPGVQPLLLSMLSCVGMKVQTWAVIGWQ